MKCNISKLIATAAVLGLVAQFPAFGADTDQPTTGKKQSMMQKLRGSKVKGAKVTSKTGEDLGQVEDIIIDPNAGKIQFVILGSGGVAGVGEVFRPVPWEALTVMSDRDYTLNIDKQKLQSAPTVTRDHFADASPADTVAIYSFCEVTTP